MMQASSGYARSPPGALRVRARPGEVHLVEDEKRRPPREPRLEPLHLVPERTGALRRSARGLPGVDKGARPSVRSTVLSGSVYQPRAPVRPLDQAGEVRHNEFLVPVVHHPGTARRVVKGSPRSWV